jgi:hypothetical protein
MTFIVKTDPNRTAPRAVFIAGFRRQNDLHLTIDGYGAETTGKGGSAGNVFPVRVRWKMKCVPRLLSQIRLFSNRREKRFAKAALTTRVASPGNNSSLNV